VKTARPRPLGPWQDDFADQILRQLESALRSCDQARLRELAAGFAAVEMTELCAARRGIDVRYRVLPDAIRPKSEKSVEVGVEEQRDGRSVRRVFQFSYRSNAPWAVFNMSDAH
jgi:hypothetical protein